MSQFALVWFRRDLRLTDHAALFHASQSGLSVLSLFVFDESKGRALGGASHWWLHHSLGALARSLQPYGQQLILKRGATLQILDNLFKQYPIKALYALEHYEPSEYQDEIALKELCKKHNLDCHFYLGDVLHHLDSFKNSKGEAFRIYSAFRKAIFSNASSIQAPLAQPTNIPSANHDIKSDNLEDWGLLPTKPDWTHGLRATWQPGEMKAQQTLQNFLATKIVSYKDLRDRPDLNATSGLSASLHFGELSIRAVWHQAKDAIHQLVDASRSVESFLQELVWRNFNIYLLYHFPFLSQKPMQPLFESFFWHWDNKAYQAWCKGQTGYPLVDAGMRELWHIGWIHNRVRMVVSSFLVKDLLIHWQEGEKWFWDTLIDADLANNVCNWQWVAGCGAGAAPYFRIFNPTLQAKKFDPEGNYIRQWVPELAKLSTRYIHQPWLAPSAVLTKANIRLGQNYPYPIVDHTQARERALVAYKEMKQ